MDETASFSIIYLKPYKFNSQAQKKWFIEDKFQDLSTKSRFKL